MPRPGSLPKYRHYKRLNQAAVLIAGRFYYLGIYNSPESRRAYDKLIAEWLAAGRSSASLAAAAATETEAGPTVSMIAAAFMDHAKGYYRDRHGNPTHEVANFIRALRPLKNLYGSTPASDFGPRCLKLCQSEMVRHGWARKTINREIGRIRHLFKWAIGEEMIPPLIIEGLRAIQPLKRGRTEARETDAIKPASELHVREVIRHASRHIAAMIELQLITGMRSGELVIMRTADIDHSTDVWTYVPTKHKTEHHGHSRAVFLGRRAQEIVTPFLKMNGKAFLFSPAEAEAERREALAAIRKTPLSCGNRAGTNRRVDPIKQPGDRYEVRSYGQAVRTACDRAFPLPAGLDVAARKAYRSANRFHPHQLRHTAATLFRRDFGIDAARALLGQRSIAATEIYAELDMDKAKRVMAEIG